MCVGFMNDLLTFCSKLEQTNYGNGEGDTATIEGNTVKYHPPFSFINIGQRGRKDYLRPIVTGIETGSVNKQMREISH